MTTRIIPRNVVVVIGTGGIGLAAARRLASGRTLYLADFNPKTLEATVQSFKEDGHFVSDHIVDVSDLAAVKNFAELASKAGHIDAIVHTAGVSPVMVPTAQRLFEINLLKTANVIDAFLPFAGVGTSLVCISSMAGYMRPLSPELEKHLATAPLDQLLTHPEIVLDSPDLDKGGELRAAAYIISKRGNHLRVQIGARAWAEKGARINSVSPGLVSTPLWHQEKNARGGEMLRDAVDASALRRIGTPEDVAGVVAFLAGPDSGLVTGTDILVDGGSIVALKWHTGRL